MSAPLVWLAPPAPEDARAAERWAEAHGVALAPPVPDTASTRPRLPVDRALGDTIDDLLERTSERLATLDFTGAEGALAEAELALRAHPELPEAAWLRAEVERGWSRRWLRGGFEGAAERAWQRAAALDGGRLSGIGERSFAAPPRAAGHLVAPAVGAGGSARIDGDEVEGFAFARAAGEHLLVVEDASGYPVYAAWLGFTGGALHLPSSVASRAASCSLEDLLPGGEPPVMARGASATCPLWFAGKPAHGTEGPLFARCHEGTCGPFTPAVRASGEARSAPASSEASERHTSWVPWVLGGAGAAVVAGVAIFLAARGGAPPAEVHFVSGGIHTTSLRGAAR